MLRKTFATTVVVAAAGMLAAAASLRAADQIARTDRYLAQQILTATGVKGGLIVHLGCGEGGLTAALRANDSYIVQGLDADAASVDKARQHVQTLNLYGPVSITQSKGPMLPYNDNLVNLVVAEKLGDISMDEVLRVLAPNGVAYIRDGGQWKKTVKQRPAEMDDWTHYLHDPSNNAVAHDSLIGPPRQMQWTGGPRYSRHHDHQSSISAQVAANGRTFYIFDEATRASILTPPKWMLVARDAFNGTILWTKQIQEWQTALWPLKSGPQLMTRRLVAEGDRVYVTLGLNAPLTALDAATGATIRTYSDTATTEEILLDQGVLYLVINKRGEPKFVSLQAAKEGAAKAWPDEGKRRIVAIQADSGKKLWEREDRILPETLTVAGGRLLYHDGDKIVCFSAANGKRNWASEPLARRKLITSFFTPTLVAYKDVVLFSGGIDDTDFGGGKTPLWGLSAKDGKVLWQCEQPVCGHHTPKDILVANGLVWYGEVAQSKDSGQMTARDPETGKIVKQFLPDANVPWFHHRCYRAKATDNFLLFSRTGIEFIDTTTNHWTPNNWVRSGCLYGIMPCNGMVYINPHPCACYEEAKLYGFTALAPASKKPPAPTPDDTRLVRGPAYDSLASNPQSPIPNPSEDWPTYRHDGARSGSSKTSVPTRLNDLWQTQLGGRLSSVVIGEGKLLVSSIDTNAVKALDARTGKPAWSFTAGGRVDSAPTIWQGQALFGCADGSVYSVRLSDGALAWRFQAAPLDRRLVAYDQVESVWPVPGSVLVHDGVAYFVAGRSVFLDGGMRLWRLDAKTGKILSETVLDDKVPGTEKDLQSKATGMNMPVGLPDILSCDGRYVYMRSLPFNLQGERKFVEYIPVREQKGDDIHLFSPTGFLDDTMWHRTYWIYGRAWASAAGGYYLAGRLVPAGRVMVFDDNTVWGYGRRWQYFRWSTPYVNHLFAAGKVPDVLQMSSESKAKKGGLTQTPVTRFAYQWSDEVPVQACAMVHAGKTLFVAGPPDLVNEDQAARAMDDPKIQAKLAEQSDAYAGKKGAILTAVSADDGKGIVSYRLASMPVFDGMAAAGGRLYYSTSDGKIVCLGEGGGKALRPARDLTVAPRSDADKPMGASPAATRPGSRKGRAA